MICPICGAFSPDDPETGYQGGEPCPSCASEGWTLTASGDLINEQEPQEVDEFDQVRR